MRKNPAKVEISENDILKLYQLMALLASEAGENVEAPSTRKGAVSAAIEIALKTKGGG